MQHKYCKMLQLHCASNLVCIRNLRASIVVSAPCKLQGHIGSFLSPADRQMLRSAFRGAWQAPHLQPTTLSMDLRGGEYKMMECRRQVQEQYSVRGHTSGACMHVHFSRHTVVCKHRDAWTAGSGAPCPLITLSHQPRVLVRQHSQ